MLAAVSRRSSTLAAYIGAVSPFLEIGGLLQVSRLLSTCSGSTFTTASGQLKAVTLRATYEHIPVGSGLDFGFGSFPVEVVSVVGAPDAVKLFAWIRPHPGTLASEAKQLRSLLDHGIRKDESSSTIWASISKSSAAISSIASIKVLAVVPSRYFSFNIESGGGPVQVAAAKEAATVSVKTHGGAIQGGNVQASEVYLDSAGGTVNVRQITAAKVGVIAHGGTVAVTTLAGIKMNIKNAGGAVNIGACFVEQSAEIECAQLQAESWRGGVIDSSSSSSSSSSKEKPCEDYLISLTGSNVANRLPEGLKAIVRGVDGSLGIRSRGAATVDLQINEGCREVEIDTAPGLGAVVALHVAPTIAAEISLSQCGEDWQLPQGTRARIDPESLAVHAQLLLEEGDLAGPKSRLQRGSMVFVGSVEDQAFSCHMSVRGAARVSVRRRSWLQARQEAFRRGGNPM